MNPITTKMILTTIIMDIILKPAPSEQAALISDYSDFSSFIVGSNIVAVVVVIEVYCPIES